MWRDSVASHIIPSIQNLLHSLKAVEEVVFIQRDYRPFRACPFIYTFPKSTMCLLVSNYLSMLVWPPLLRSQSSRTVPPALCLLFAGSQFPLARRLSIFGPSAPPLPALRFFTIGSIIPSGSLFLAVALH